MNNQHLPQNTTDLRSVIKTAIELYQGSPVKNENKLNEVLAKSLNFPNYDSLAPIIKEEQDESNEVAIQIPFVYIDDRNNVTIEDYEIDEEIFDEQKVNYVLRTTEELIDDLYDYIGEASRANRDSDRTLMIEDVRYLHTLKDEFVFSSVETNEYIAASDNPERFVEICKEIIDTQKALDKANYIEDADFEDIED